MEKTRRDTSDSFSFEKAEQEEGSPHPHNVHGLGFEGKQPKRRFHSKWHFLKTKKFWAILFCTLVGAFATLWFVQPARFWTLNFLGIKAGLVVNVYDAKSNSGIQGAEVILHGKQYATQKDSSGKRTIAIIKDARFGKQTLTVRKNGYATNDRQITLTQFSRGTTEQAPATNMPLTPTGLPVTVRAVHWLSKKPLEGLTVSVGDITATTNKEGKASLNIPPTDQTEVEVKITGGSYLPATLKAKLGGAEQAVSLVDSPRHYFISKRTGTLGIYSSNLDGSDAKQLIAGTGKEQENGMKFEISPDNKFAALVASREGTRNVKGQLLEQLYIVNLESATLTKVDESPNLDIVAWLDNSLAYTRDTNDMNTGYVKYREIMSYDASSKNKRTLSQANYFYSILAGRGKIFFSPGVYDSDKGANYKNSQASFMSITPDERQKITIDPTQTWQVTRTDFSTLAYQTSDQKWHEFNLDSNTKKDLPGEPANNRVRVFSQSNNGQQIAWVDQRDGKDVLLIRGSAAGSTDKVLYQTNGIKQPIRWIGDKLVTFRVSSNQETADYVVSTDGGEPHKISDVSGTGGVNQGNYQ